MSKADDKPTKEWQKAACEVLKGTSYTVRILRSHSWDFYSDDGDAVPSAHSTCFHVLVFVPGGEAVEGQGATLSEAVKNAKGRLESKRSP